MLRLAEFYRRATGLNLALGSGVRWAAGPGGLFIGFQLAKGEQPSRWPDDSPRAHLDFAVADLDEALVLGLGVAKPGFRPESARVFIDPAALG